MGSSTTGKSRNRQIAEGDEHLPVTESTAIHAGPNSPFGEDQTLPLPVETLEWETSGPAKPRLDSYWPAAR